MATQGVMASATKQPPRNPPGFGGTLNGTSSLLLGKAKLHAARRSTPDSEALASSDEEHDQPAAMTASQPTLPRPPRRGSWLAEVAPAPQRKISFTGVSYTSGSSQPTTPAADQTPWSNSTSGRTPSSSASSFPWSSQIWSQEPARKEPPTRLTEVLQSPTTVGPSNNAIHEEAQAIMSSPLKELGGDNSFPFAIPLYPTPKTYRSQSYSVGQMEADLNSSASSNGTVTGRRTGMLSSLKHRPSRPSMLSEMGHDGHGLGRVREDEDDDEDSTNGSEGSQGLHLSQSQQLPEASRTMLKHTALENSWARRRAATTDTPSFGNGTTQQSHMTTNGGEHALDEFDDLGFQRRSLTGRRFSEYGTPGGESRFFGQLADNAELRRIENIKKAQWQSSLGFSGLAEGSQSRRHSFADVPTRSASFHISDRQDLAPSALKNSTSIDVLDGYNDGMVRPSPRDEIREYNYFIYDHQLAEREMEQEHLHDRNYAAQYFSGVGPAMRGVESNYTPPLQMHHGYALQQQNTHGIPHQYGLTRPTQQLYIVAFKCARADVFYIQEGTGLAVNPGDMVIVEADRGTDLGTVTHSNVTWAKAKELKEAAAEDHYRWLMMFSRHGQSGQVGAVNPNGLMPHGERGGPHNLQDGTAADIKPKMIKRLAQNHEIQTLRDKEGNEAKAKRVCQQKVVEHRLNMEILDAEFQMDWKKLTFYYFADTYINFNTLVTDLFKIYKTRIWMSAINPASFASPTMGIPPPSAMGPGAISGGSEVQRDSRAQPDGLGIGMYRPFAPGNPSPTRTEASSGPLASPFQPAPFGYPSAGVQPSVSPLNGFSHARNQQLDPFTMAYIPSVYQTGISQAAMQYGMGLDDGANGRHAIPNGQPLGQEWMATFQNLSLGSSTH